MLCHVRTLSSLWLQQRQDPDPDRGRAQTNSQHNHQHLRSDRHRPIALFVAVTIRKPRIAHQLINGSESRHLRPRRCETVIGIVTVIDGVDPKIGDMGAPHGIGTRIVNEIGHLGEEPGLVAVLRKGKNQKKLLSPRFCHGSLGNYHRLRRLTVRTFSSQYE